MTETVQQEVVTQAVTAVELTADETIQAARKRLIAGVPKCLDILAKTMVNPPRNAMASLMAAKTWLDRAGLPEISSQSSGPANVTIVQVLSLPRYGAGLRPTPVIDVTPEAVAIEAPPSLPTAESTD